MSSGVVIGVDTGDEFIFTLDGNYRDIEISQFL